MEDPCGVGFSLVWIADEWDKKGNDERSKQNMEISVTGSILKLVTRLS